MGKRLPKQKMEKHLKPTINYDNNKKITRLIFQNGYRKTSYWNYG